MAIQFQIRRGLSTDWTANNVILAQGEFGLETDTGYIKIGDGVSSWNNLKYTVSTAQNLVYALAV